MSSSINWPAAVGAILIPNVGGLAGAAVVRRNISPWYQSLKRPCWTPPNWAFGPVWVSLYSGIGYASYLAYRDGGGFNGPARLPLILYGSNLALNWAWTPLFFHAHQLRLAFHEIHLVTLTAIGTGVLFHKINPVAGLLFVPYVLWLGLATALTYRILRDNPKIEEIKEE